VSARASETAVLAGGCFWCLEAVFEQLRGVERAVSGYTGGVVEEPSYEDVCSGRTGHAEAVSLTFDPSVVSYRDLLEIFFSIHDPTTLNRQGADVGTQYRSAIFFTSEAQRRTAELVIKELEASGVWKGIVTQVAPLKKFFEAEEYHQEYFRRNPQQGYCRMVVAPKVAKFRKKWESKLKS
jgi:peptide-methionine (S)-S-oxide reductase